MATIRHKFAQLFECKKKDKGFRNETTAYTQDIGVYKAAIFHSLMNSLLLEEDRKKCKGLTPARTEPPINQKDINAAHAAIFHELAEKLLLFMYTKKGKGLTPSQTAPTDSQKDEKTAGATAPDSGGDEEAAYLKQMKKLGAPKCGKKGDENWAHCSEVAKRLGTTTGSLRQDRKENKTSPFMGVDVAGRAWSKRGVKTDTFYLRISIGLPLLTENFEPSKEKS